MDRDSGGREVFMNGFNKFLAATFLSAAMLFTSAAQAMEIRQFDKMADQDQAEYVGLLVQGAEKVLIDEGRTDLQQQVHQLFSTTPSGDFHAFGNDREDAWAAHLRVEHAGQGQVRIADNFRFKALQREAGEQAVVGVFFGGIGADRSGDRGLSPVDPPRLRGVAGGRD